MTEEKTPAELEAEEQAKVEEAKAKDAEFEAEITDLSDEDKEARRAERQKALHPDKGIDYQAIAEKEKEARLRAEKTLADKAFKDRQAKRDSGNDIDDDDKPLTRAEALELLKSQPARGNFATKEDLLGAEAKVIADRLAGSTEERDALLETWKNRTFPEHVSLEDQLEEVYVIVNRKQLIGKTNEAMRALKNKSNVSRDAANTEHDRQTGPTTQPKTPADIKTVAQQTGFSYNQATKRYEKKSKGGKLIYIDPVTNKVMLEDSKQAPMGA